ncbi:hypothetical protein RJ639_001945 [Escallonia herrerae]|uniref:Uncharacterized protein n=1 Tax=Escallonia herrerae TaxID=1293975 RepID=A0AA88XCB0_9ASTE|nr:hypothetical protein RJ639_001945 [Escallonia herrerae]
MQRQSPPKHRHDGTSPLPLGMDWSPPPRKWVRRHFGNLSSFDEFDSDLEISVGIEVQILGKSLDTVAELLLATFHHSVGSFERTLFYLWQVDPNVVFVNPTKQLVWGFTAETCDIRRNTSPVWSKHIVFFSPGKMDPFNPWLKN